MAAVITDVLLTNGGKTLSLSTLWFQFQESSIFLANAYISYRVIKKTSNAQPQSQNDVSRYFFFFFVADEVTENTKHFIFSYENR